MSGNVKIRSDLCSPGWFLPTSAHPNGTPLEPPILRDLIYSQVRPDPDGLSLKRLIPPSEIKDWITKKNWSQQLTFHQN
ncbi:hypothetical protein KY284_036744 [Solanum tuberosum]|nr:hypothetical protein KY284_036744 [Solanum tuberosum]